MASKTMLRIWLFRLACSARSSLSRHAVARALRKAKAERSMCPARCTTISRSEERRVGKECRSLCDWSSDVCSSDLGMLGEIIPVTPRGSPGTKKGEGRKVYVPGALYDDIEIGRASCRERV